MIIRENVIINDKEYIKTYSDKGFYIERDEIQYSEAIDPIEFKDERIYTETDIPIEVDEEEATVEDYQNKLRELGVLTDDY